MGLVKFATSAAQSKRKVAWRSHACHCEERSDEAISTPSKGDCFASLAMTYRTVLSNDFAFALICVTVAPLALTPFGGYM